MDFLKKTLNSIQPTQNEIKKLNNLFLDIKQYILSKYNINSALMGSVAKNTFLKKDNDLDIFIFFDISVSAQEMEKKALLIGKNAFRHFGGNYVIDYASHPYVKGKIKNCLIEIVPCYKLNSIRQMKSAVDRTQFHTKYVLKHLKPSQRGDVLLIKQFLKTMNCYGSDLKTKGFSGYLCELLIIKYNSFENALKEISVWGKNTFIYLSEFQLENKKKNVEFNNPLIFLDPVDESRNVAASLSFEVLLKTKYYAQKYLSKPNEIYFNKNVFEKKTNTKKSLKDLLKNRYFYCICFEKPNIVDDILYPQLERFKNSIEKYILSNNFALNNLFFDCDKSNNLCIIGFDFATDKLSYFIHRQGPNLFTKQEKTKLFFKKHKNIYFDKCNYICFEKRKITNAFDLIKSISKKKIQKHLAIPKEIEKKLNKNFVALDAERLQQYAKEKKISKKVICRNISGGKIIDFSY